jgi:hypothetical protein
MRKFRLKKEAVPFFKEQYATAIKEWDYWQKLGADEMALEEVESCFVTYGIKRSDFSSSLSGWGEEGTHFHFTLNFPGVKCYEHDLLTSGKTSRELMDEIQDCANNFYIQFYEKTIQH